MLELAKEFGLRVYAWDGELDDVPEPGDSASMGYWGMLQFKDGDMRNVDMPKFIELPCNWGDYCGSTVDRANMIVFMDGYRDHVIEMTSNFGGQHLLIREGVAPEGLREDLERLRDYPILEESELSQVEMELEQELWEIFGEHDFISEIEKAAGDHAPEAYDKTVLAGLIYDVSNDGETLQFCAEGATGGYWTDMERAGELAWDSIRAARWVEWCKLAASMEGPKDLALFEESAQLHGTFNSLFVGYVPPAVESETVGASV